MLKCTNNKADTTTNEEMALLIQQGYSEYIPLLWERVYPLICYILQRQICNYPLPNYITIEDLKQQMYFAFLRARAVKVYTEEKELYTTLHNAINTLTPIEKSIITQYFYLNKSDNTIAMCSGMTTNEIFNIRRNAITKLRKNKVLCRFYKAYSAT